MLVKGMMVVIGKRHATECGDKHRIGEAGVIEYFHGNEYVVVQMCSGMTNLLIHKVDVLPITDNRMATSLLKERNR